MWNDIPELELKSISSTIVVGTTFCLWYQHSLIYLVNQQFFDCMHAIFFKLMNVLNSRNGYQILQDSLNFWKKVSYIVSKSLLNKNLLISDSVNPFECQKLLKLSKNSDSTKRAFFWRRRKNIKLTSFSNRDNFWTVYA